MTKFVKDFDFGARLRRKRRAKSSATSGIKPKHRAGRNSMLAEYAVAGANTRVSTDAGGKPPRHGRPMFTRDGRPRCKSERKFV
jgi:hypothetical protein